MVRYIEKEDLTIQGPLPKAYLTLLVGERISHSFPLQGEVRLGRDGSNAVIAADQKVSRHHATLIPIDDTYIISDKGSANGTYVNGVRISQPTRLREKDRLSLGDTTFLFTLTQPDAEVVKPSSPPVNDIASLTIEEKNNRRVWMVVGCMAIAIIILLMIVALLLGIFLGRSQVAMLVLWWLVNFV